MTITEKIISFLWLSRKFEQLNLKSVQNEPILITKTGWLNSNSGPDFKEAEITIGNLNWIGQVEIHIKTTDWKRHGHQKDPNYDSVILHVVWENDINESDTLLWKTPILELKSLVNENTIKRVNEIIGNQQNIKCKEFIGSVPDIVFENAKQNALLRRLERKSEEIETIYKSTYNDFNETLYQWFSKCFGGKLNANNFLILSQRISYKLITKYIDDTFKLESMLFGVAGFLDKNLNNEYYLKLQDEYNFLCAKHPILKNKMKESQWQFFRLNPNAFSTLRLSQWAAFLSITKNLLDFSLSFKGNFYKESNAIRLKIMASEYWNENYVFGKVSVKIPKKIGVQFWELFIINGVSTFLYFHSVSLSIEDHLEECIRILESLKVEENIILKDWEEVARKGKTAFDSQAMIELYNNDCKFAKCLECPVGIEILKT